MSKKTVSGLRGSSPAKPHNPNATRSRTPTPHEDAALFELILEWVAAEEAFDALWSQYDQANGDLTGMPEAPVPRSQDAFLLSPLTTEGKTYDAEWLASIDQGKVKCFRTLAGDASAHVEVSKYCASVISRFDEIVADVWRFEAAHKARLEATGVAALSRAVGEASRQAVDLGRRLMLTPSRTVDGMLAKLAAVMKQNGATEYAEKIGEALGIGQIHADHVAASAMLDFGMFLDLGVITSRGIA